MQTTEYNQIQSVRNKFIDYCQECQCYHQLVLINQEMVLNPCENKIHQQLPVEQKTSTETNVTTSRQSHALSINSLSNVSIKTHIPLTNKPNMNKVVTKETIYSSNCLVNSQSVINSDSNSSKFKQRIYYVSKQKLQPKMMKINGINKKSIKQRGVVYCYDGEDQKKRRDIEPYRQQQLITYRQQQLIIRNNNQNDALFKNNKIITSQPVNYYNQTNLNQPSTIIHPRQPIIICDNLCIPSSMSTPQFGSQSLITENTQNKQNTSDIYMKRKAIKKSIEKQIIKSTNRLKSNISDDNDKITKINDQEGQYFCCGYLKKC